MTRQEVLNYLKCSESALYKMTQSGLIKKDGKDYTDESVYALTGNAKTVHTVTEAADLLDLSNKSVLSLVKKGEIKTFKIGSGSGNSGLRLADLNLPGKPKASVKVRPLVKAEPKNVEPKAKAEPKPKKVESDSNKSRVVIKKVKVGDAELIVSLHADQDLPETKLIKDYVKVVLDKSDLEYKLEKLKELMG